jgi:acid stress chaperone HdeB
MKLSTMMAALCVSVSLLVSAPALAKKTQMQDIDFGAITCGEFMKEISASSAEDVGVVLMWIDGYLSGVSGDTVLNWENLEEFSTELVAYCGKKPDVQVLEAAEEVGIDDE